MDNEDVPKIQRSLHERLSGKKAIIILDMAHLSVARGPDKTYVLLNSMTHHNLIKNSGHDVEEYRPDITHQCLMMLQDSPLNKRGLLNVFIRTADNQLISVHPQLSVPRLYDQFAALMVMLLVNRKVKARENSTNLISIIKNNLDDILPPGSHKIGLSVNGEKLSIEELITTTKMVHAAIPVVFFVGAVAKSDPAAKCELCERRICISDSPLSAANCCGKICDTLESLWT